MALLSYRGSRIPFGARLAVIATLVVMGVGGLPGVASSAPVSPRWAMRYDGFAFDDQPTDLGVSPDGSTVWVTGMSRNVGATGYDYATVAYDAVTGVNLWTRRYDGRASGFDYAAALGVSPDGSQVVVTGQTRRSRRHQYDYATIAYDGATGAEVWVSRYNGMPGGDDGASALGIGPDGSVVFVTGFSESPRDNNLATVAYAAATGRRLWVARQGNVDSVEAITVSPDGSTVVITGSTLAGRSEDSENFATVAYDADTGTELWVRRYDGPSNLRDGAIAVDVSPDGSEVFVTGVSRAAPRNDDYATVAYDAATGAGLWERRYDGPANRDDFPHDIAVSHDGSLVFVTGGSRRATRNFDSVTVAYDTDMGKTTWVRRFDEPLVDHSGGLYVSSDGSEVLVSGDNLGETPTSQTAVAYEAATGALRWVQRFSDGSGERIHASTFSPDGSELFVTRTSWDGVAQNNDYATVAYDVP